ncbi:MAG TPA: AI-2E family transporter [Candidatus Saccharimonadales bacterium]|nr:AI-2E family transporter [Candidatus Saccharimonadales bacterium]
MEEPARPDRSGVDGEPIGIASPDRDPLASEHDVPRVPARTAAVPRAARECPTTSAAQAAGGAAGPLSIIGPILSANPALMPPATVQPIVAAFLLYAVIQQLENDLPVPKIQGDAVRLHPSAVMFARVIGDGIGGLLGAILAVSVTAVRRGTYRYLLSRLSPTPAAPSRAAEAALGLGAGVDRPDRRSVRGAAVRLSDPNA